MPTPFPHLFSPVRMGPLLLRNRLVMTTHGTRLSSQRYLRYLDERAAGGVALIGVPAGFGVYVYPSGPGRVMPGFAGDFDAIQPDPSTNAGRQAYDDAVIPMLRAQGEVVHARGAACVGQIHHPGASRNADPLAPAIGPSEVPDDYRREVPHVLRPREIAAVVEAFAQAARRIKESGLDGVELHGAHGYLINQFLSPHWNRRTDAYGGSPENRLRFLREVIAAVRGQVGDAFPIGLRLTGDELLEGGLRPDDAAEVARCLSADLAYVLVSGGSYTGLRDGPKLPYVAPWYVPEAPMAAAAAYVKGHATVPVIVSGRITDPVLAERLVADGVADLVGMARAFIADPAFAAKAETGRLDDLRRCIANNECHQPGRPLVCAVNPASGREEEMEIRLAAVRKQVVVVGSGPAGLEAARAAAERGHAVTLLERAPALGGMLATIALDPNRAQMVAPVHYLERQIRRLGVDVRLGVEATAQTVADLRPDACVVATGARPYRPAVPGVDLPHVVTAEQVLRDQGSIGTRVLVVAGLDDHLAAPTLADLLAGLGAQVMLVAESLVVGQGIEPGTLHVLTQRLLEKGVRMEPLTRLVGVEAGSARVRNIFTGAERTLEAETVVLACGGRARDELVDALEGVVPEVYAVGDCRAPRRLLHATLEGARVGGLI